MKNKTTVAILLTTFNSEKYLREQLDSILKQKDINVVIYISDDGSTDSTLKIIKFYFKKYPKNFKKLYNVKFSEACSNFYNLILQVPKYKYYAMSDHDDIWLEDKLSRAINFLKKGYDLYGSRVKAVDENLNFIGYSPLFKRKPSFKNALVQGLFANCTTVFTNKIMELVKIKKINFITDPAWLLYLIATFYGKNVYYDKVPKILYRQHSNNIMGIGFSWRSKFLRLYYFFLGVNQRLNNNHVNFLRNITIKPFNKNIQTLNRFDFMRKNMNYFNFNERYFKNLGVYRQTKKSNFLLKIGIILNLE
jgi:glycosyltransferase involved in cell wall biosynthesis